MADLNTLYEQMRDSADDMTKASVEMKQMMVADENTDVPIGGYGPKPSFSKQIKTKADIISDLFENGLYGYILLESFQAGSTIRYRNHALHDLTSGEYFRWDGVIPAAGKVIPPNSTPVPQGPGGWISVSDAALRSDLARGKTDSLVGNQLDYPGSVLTTQRARNNLFPTVLDFGADPTGVRDSTSAFHAAMGAVPTSVTLLIPSGVYELNAEITGNNHRVILMEPVTFTGSGSIIRATVTRVMPDGTTRTSQWAKPGTTEYMTASAVFGDLGATATGIQIGGAVPHNGSDGAMLFSDGSCGWVGLRASKWPHPTELAIYPSTRSGVCRTITGTNNVTFVSGEVITNEAIGKPISIYDTLYTVTAVTGSGFTVSYVNGGAVSWPSSVLHAFTLCYYHGNGKCSIKGKVLSRISGDPFVMIDPTGPQTVTINGTDYFAESFTDPQHITLRSAPGDTAETDYKFWGTINTLNSALRVHRLIGAGFEENISLIANNAGFFALHAAAGNPANEQYPIFIGSGWESNGQMRKSLIAGPDGSASLGGYYGNAPLFVPYSEVAGRPQVMIDNSTGAATISSIGGLTPDASLGLKAKGAGRIVANSELAVNAACYPFVDNVYTSGRPGNRWSQVWAVNGVIQVSDKNAKMDIVPCDLSEAFIRGLNPVSYKFKVGGNRIENVEEGFEEVEQPVTEIAQVTEEVQERVVEGEKVYYVRKQVTRDVERQVYHDVELRDEAGEIIGSVKTPLTKKVMVPKTSEVIIQDPGKRTHYGFLSQEVKALIDKLGITDFGGYIEGEDGTFGLRYDEFISPIVATLQRVMERLDSLEAK